MEDSSLSNSIFTQKRTAEKLVEESRADADFYVFLCASVFMTSIGLVINSPIVIVGAMLVAPMLYPILALGLGVVTASQPAIKRALVIIAQAAGISIAIAFVTSFLIDVNGTGLTDQLELLIEPPLFLFFLISLASGIVASFAWVTEETTLSLPGIAITVSLVPPISAVGIAITLLSRPLFIGSLMLFVINLIGIVLSSVVVFSLFELRRVRAWQDDLIREEQELATEDADTSEQEAYNSGEET